MMNPGDAGYGADPFVGRRIALGDVFALVHPLGGVWRVSDI